MSKAIRELLLRKTDNPNLRFFIHSASDKIIQDMVIESLEKMADYKDKKAVKFNSAVRDFLNTAIGEVQAGEPNPMEHLRDAMGHHASHYAAANKAGNQPLAEEHAKQFLKLGHLAHKLHSSASTIANFEPGHDMDYKIAMSDIARVNAPSLQAWQATAPHWFRNHHGKDKTKHVDELVDYPNWFSWYKQDGVRANGVYTIYKEDENGNKIVDRQWETPATKKSFAWLANNPHPEHKDIGKHIMNGHDESGYPMEQVTINGKHIPVGVVESPNKLVSHPFDSHPILDHFDDKPEVHALKADQYKSRLAVFHGGANGMALAMKGAELADPDHGKEPGMQVHPKLPKVGE